MNSLDWLKYYRANASGRVEPEWHLPCPLDLEVRSALAHSLSHFQLGESGDGHFLLGRAVAKASEDAAYQEALRFFVAEEQEHARLLEHLVGRFRGYIIGWHWTQALFRIVRRALGLNFELQVLVIAELIGTAYYRLLHARSRDPVLEQVCDRILRDENGHVDFHADWLSDSHLCFLPLERALWDAQFQILFGLAAQIAWFDHRSCLKTIGASRREFFREARRECIHFLRRLERSEATELRTSSRATPSVQ